MNLQTWFHPHQQLLLRYAARIRLDPRSWGSTSKLIQTTYHVVLNRAAQPDEQARWVTSIRRGETKWTGIVWQLLCSNELQQLHSDWSLPRDPMQVQHALHQARCSLVRTELPAADTIADLGGACTEAISGALLWMGYPHPAREITIIDLPPSNRMFADTFNYIAAETANWIEVGQTRIRYIHTVMTDMSGLADASVDMLWLGQSIEHITQAQARQVYGEALRVLKPGGYFCLDTPNRTLTRLQSSFGYIHPEHKHEYRPAELAHQLTRAGLVVKRTLGVCPMPYSVRRQRFYPQEILDHGEVSPDAASSYFFYIESVKP
ncbi:putative S-adenosylmethionine-dependent methyltransferase/MSMEI_2290 [Thermoflexales bacterium]|nr:putative S-adenosylmethionine-dependent methyltransferase/MSMEI_2290 [Thermoflexales bacterium]